MLRTISIVPAILTDSKAEFRTQLEKVNTYTNRVQIDVTDGQFARSSTIDLSNVWWPNGWTADLHMMVAQPSQYLETVLRLAPSLCIFHAEASENLSPVFARLKQQGIRTGVAMLPSTYPGYVKKYIEEADYVLIFGGQLGAQGGQADMMQMEKVALVRDIKAEVEIGWDGGANMSNIRALAHGGIDTINVGSALSQAENPAAVYAEMVAETDKSGVVL